MHGSCLPLQQPSNATHPQITALTRLRAERLPLLTDTEAPALPMLQTRSHSADTRHHIRRITARRYACPHNLHGATATRAGELWSRLHPAQCPIDIELEQEVQQLDQPFAIGVQETKVARTPESLRQHVLQQ